MPKNFLPSRAPLAFATLLFASFASAQTSVQVFSPVNVRPSTQGTGYGTAADVFNSSTLNLACPSSGPITAVLSSTPDGKGNLLVDNSINVTVTSGSSITGPTNVCLADRSNTPGIIIGDCFTAAYQTRAGSLIGVDPDTLTATGGVLPIDLGPGLQPGSQQVQIALTDTGGYLASSSVYLATNCTATGVSGPGNITGNPIPQTNPTQQQLTQNFAFNTTAGQQVKFVYDLSQAQAANSLTIQPNTIPGTEDLPINPATFQSVYETGTSFATANCLIHSGETVNGMPACKLYTLACSVGTSATESGAECPRSSLPNEIFQDVFDGPAFTLTDIPTPGGTVFHEGIGFLMASEGWNGGPCAFDPASGLQDLPCPQNLLTNFSGPGLFIMSGGTSHPNSAFIAVAQVPEDLTSVSVANEQPGYWINTRQAMVTLSSQPPSLKGTSLPGANNFVPAPIASITYGVSAANQVPTPAAPATTDTVVANGIPCPTPSNPLDPPATTFTTAAQTVNFDSDGTYLLHYYAQDCAGTREYHFTQNTQGNWSTSYYTVPVNVDTVPPVIASGPTLSPAAGPNGAYTVGETVTATYSCTDDRSGLVQCGATTYPFTAQKLASGTLTSPVNTSTPGTKTYTVTAVDAAGNHASVSVQYTVIAAYDASIHLRLDSSTVRANQVAVAFVQVAPSNGHTATGTVTLLDGTQPLRTERLHGDGQTNFVFGPLSVGTHSISVQYSGDAMHPAGQSAPATLTVQPDNDDGGSGN